MAFFVSFIVVAGFIVLNLFIGIILLHMEHATADFKHIMHAREDIARVKEMHNLTDADMHNFHGAFEGIDTDESGVITPTELRAGLTQAGIGISREQVLVLARLADDAFTDAAEVARQVQ